MVIVMLDETICVENITDLGLQQNLQQAVTSKRRKLTHLCYDNILHHGHASVLLAMSSVTFIFTTGTKVIRFKELPQKLIFSFKVGA